VRRCWSARSSLSSRGEPSQRPEAQPDPETAFARFFERNRVWQRAKDEHLQQRADEDLREKLQPWEAEAHARRRPRSASARLRSACSDGPRCVEAQVHAMAAASASSSTACGSARARGGSAGGVAAADPASSTRSIRPAAGQPVRASRDLLTCSASSSSGAASGGGNPERAEVMGHLQALRVCLAGSHDRGWQRAIRVERARVQGAGAAPYRRLPTDAVLAALERPAQAGERAGTSQAGKGRLRTPSPSATARSVSRSAALAGPTPAAVATPPTAAAKVAGREAASVRAGSRDVSPRAGCTKPGSRDVSPVARASSRDVSPTAASRRSGSRPPRTPKGRQGSSTPPRTPRARDQRQLFAAGSSQAPLRFSGPPVTTAAPTGPGGGRRARAPSPAKGLAAVAAAATAPGAVGVTGAARTPVLVGGGRPGGASGRHSLSAAVAQRRGEQ